MLKGRILEPGQAKAQYDAFWEFTNDAQFPHAVCYKLSELRTFFTMADAALTESEVPEEQKGIALMIGIHLDRGSSHAYGKPTIMLVATQWIDNSDETAGKVDAINNPILNEGWPVELTRKEGRSAELTRTPVRDTSYDAGSLWP